MIYTATHTPIYIYRGYPLAEIEYNIKYFIMGGTVVSMVDS